MSEQVVQGIADEKLDELADLLAHWQRNRAKGITPRAVRTAIFMSLDETQLVSSLRAQVAALTEKVERLQDESARLSDSLGQINAVCIATYPECSGTALAEVVRHLKSDRDKYKANLDEFRRDYRLLLEKDEDDPGNTLDTPDARLLRERDRYKATLERIKDETCCGETRKIAAEAVQS